MALIENLRQNGTERIAHQHIIDFARQSDRELKNLRAPNWWRELTGSEDIEGLEGQDIAESIIFPVKEKNHIKNFDLTSEFQMLDGEMKSYIEKTVGIAGKEKIFSEFAGAVFERLAYLYFVDKNKDEGQTLTPPETDQFFLKTFPDHKVREYPFGKIGLEGLVVPDSLVLDQQNIRYQAEFSLHRAQDYYHDKHDGFIRNKYSKSVGHEYEDAKLVFGVPNSFPQELRESLELSYGEDTEFFILPFSHKDFSKIIKPLEYLIKE